MHLGLFNWPLFFFFEYTPLLTWLFLAERRINSTVCSSCVVRAGRWPGRYAFIAHIWGDWLCNGQLSHRMLSRWLSIGNPMLLILGANMLVLKKRNSEIARFELDQIVSVHHFCCVSLLLEHRVIRRWFFNEFARSAIQGDSKHLLCTSVSVYHGQKFTYDH